MLRPSPVAQSPDAREGFRPTQIISDQTEEPHGEGSTSNTNNMSRSLLETSFLECFCELTYGCYFKLAGGRHFFVSKQETNPTHPYEVHLVPGDVASAVQHGGNNVIMAPGEILYVLGKFELDKGGGIQMKGCHVRHCLALSSEQYSQLLVHLSVALTKHYTIEVWEREMVFMPLKQLEFRLNEFAMPFYAVEKYYSSPEWAQQQMQQCIPELEENEDLRNQYGGYCWVFREHVPPEIFSNPHDVLIACFNASVPVIPVRISVPYRI